MARSRPKVPGPHSTSSEVAPAETRYPEHAPPGLAQATPEPSTVNRSSATPVPAPRASPINPAICSEWLDPAQDRGPNRSRWSTLLATVRDQRCLTVPRCGRQHYSESSAEQGHTL